MKRLIIAVLGIVVILAGVVVIRALPSAEQSASGTPYPLAVDVELASELMSQAIQYETISYGRDKPTSGKALRDFHAFLEDRFPRVHAELTYETVNEFSLLYHWQGSGNGAEKPVLLLGHMDVVPIIPGTADEWDHAPYAGVIDETYVWGRGAMDDKLNVIAGLQAIEMMLEAGLRPKRDIYLAFGHDEEQGGLEGAREIARLLKQRNVQAEFLIDEGGAVVEGAVPGLTVSVAAVAPAEKGIVTLELIARGKGGHSSMPPKQSSIGILSAGIVRLEENPFPRDFSHTQKFLEAIADDLPFSQRLVMKNLWLFKPLVMQQMQNERAMQAAMRTTTAATIMNAGVKANVLPISARALVNFRILPGETKESVKAKVIEILDDTRISVEYSQSGQIPMDPSPVSPLSGFGWEHLQATIRDIAAPERIIIAPRLLVAATDTRHYREISDNHYRFVWMRANSKDLGRIHGTNERIEKKSIADAVRFYHRFISQL
ncbi:M20/M25/M40 family metallo-hydrolase [Alphaproteobacteria bacterium]|nr:M20/M25/M40 family metallo-hydrolase [Alphaproteobacteria bacterium]